MKDIENILDKSEDDPRTEVNRKEKNITSPDKNIQEYTGKKKKKKSYKDISRNPKTQQTCITNSHQNTNGNMVLVNKKQKLQQKMNAFQVMMESRNKVIGMNSSGKEAFETENFYDKTDKDKLFNRKKIFIAWAENKGAAKRKREEEKDEIIKIKLTKRRKRLKKLLKIENESDKNLNIKKSTKKVRKLSSDYEAEVATNSDENDLTNKFSTNTSTEKVHITNIKSETLNENEGKESVWDIFKKIDKENITLSTTTNSKGDFQCNGKSKVKSNLKYKERKNSDEIIENNLYERDEKEEHSEKKQKKKFRRKKKKGLHNDESSQDSVYNGNTSKLWKMKIKINENDIDIHKSKGYPKSVSKIVNIKSDDESLNHSDGTISISSSDEDEFETKKAPVKSLKIAPVFAKATPKPKLDPNIVEARRQFLLSGTPSLLKKIVEKQRSLEEKDVDVFPSVSHVQQKCNHPYWNLLKPKLDLTDQTPLDIKESLLLCKELSASKIETRLNLRTEVEKVGKLKVLLNRIKSNNPNYPVYKSFKFLYNTGGYNDYNKTKNKFTSVTKQKRRNKQNEDPDIEIINQENEHYRNEFAMWTEKYRFRSSDNILGNSEAIKSLKKWLETWKNFSQEINSRKKRRNSSSSEFESTDCDSRYSDQLPGNTVILGGPCGSGKSSTVYAICEELEFNVIEINASSKRTGKKLLQELQEATQSHQVRKAELALANFFESNSSKQKTENIDRQSERKMCVLFVEDIDIVFEQDDGFIFSLTQLINTSKRPIILTTTNYNSSYIQKNFNDNECISFLPLSSNVLATWLQILCLVEGLFVEKGDISSLLNSNKGDIRKTILQLQFWVQSGGQLNLTKMPISIIHSTEEIEENFIDDENIEFLKSEVKGKTSYVTHKDCLRSFQIFENHQNFCIPYYLDLGLLWWNIPNVLEWPNIPQRNKTKQEECRVSKRTEIKKKSSNENVNYQLTRFYESILFTDIMFRKLNHFDSSEPTVRNYNQEIGDSLELTERIDELSSEVEFTHDITHTLVDGYIKEYNNKKHVQSKFDVGLPGILEKRWRAKQHVCEDIFREGLYLMNYERKSFALDYFPTLRAISRSEIQKMSNNAKRGNRFRSYFKDLGISCSESTIKLANNILQETEITGRSLVTPR